MRFASIAPVRSARLPAAASIVEERSTMVSSINTNPAALAALQVLNATGREADEVQFRITTGLKVGRPSDNDAIYSISQNMRGEVSGLDAVATPGRLPTPRRTGRGR